MNLLFNRIISYVKKNPGLVVISLVYFLIFFLMLPLRNLGYDDDFAYITTTEHLIKTGELKMSDWVAAAIIFQVYWGALFAKIFGYSIKVLHLSNIFLLYLGLIAFYQLLKRLKLEEFRAVIFTCALLSFPWVFQLTYSYMSDVFYMSLLIISLYFYVRGMQDNSKFSYLLGSFFAGFAFLNRQIGVIIPVSVFLILLYRSITFNKFPGRQLLLSIVPVSIIIFLYFVWQNQTGMTAGQNLSLGPTFRKGLMISIWPFSFIGHTSITDSFYIQILQRGTGYLNQLGGFLFPLTFIFIIKFQKLRQFFYHYKKYIFTTTILFLVIYQIDNLYKFKFSTTLPDILYYDSLLKWAKFWQPFAILSTALWILMIAVTTKYIISTLFMARKRYLTKTFKIMVSLSIFWALYHFYTIYYLSIRPKPHFIGAIANWDLRALTSYLTNPDNIPTIQVIFKETWFFFLVVLSIIISLTYLFTHFKFKFSKRTNSAILFLVLTFLLEATVVIIPAYFYWNNYVIQFIPFIIILIAYISRKIEISRFRTIVVVTLLLLLSLEITRNRYQIEGAKWELGTNLVENGVNIKNIQAINWAWRPYWLFQSSFDDAVKASGGDKYKVSQIEQWDNNLAPGLIYKFINVSPAETVSIKKVKQVISESEDIWTFKGISRILIIKENN